MNACPWWGAWRRTVGYVSRIDPDYDKNSVRLLLKNDGKLRFSKPNNIRCNLLHLGRFLLSVIKNALLIFHTWQHSPVAEQFADLNCLLATTADHIQESYFEDETWYVMISF
jgi:hypothetical protein